MLPASCSPETALVAKLVEGISELLSPIPEDRQGLPQYPEVRPLQANLFF